MGLWGGGWGRRGGGEVMGGWDTLRGIEARREGRIFFAHGLHGG